MPGKAIFQRCGKRRGVVGRSSSVVFADAYAALTGQRVPEVLERPSSAFTRVVFCPSARLGAFVSFIAYEPDLVVYSMLPVFWSDVRSGARTPASVGSRGICSKWRGRWQILPAEHDRPAPGG